MKKYYYDKCRRDRTTVPYNTLHLMMRKRLPEPDKCPTCGTTTKLDLCNKSGNYLVDDEDWFYACRSCHQKYDYTDERREAVRVKMIGNRSRKGQVTSQEHREKISAALKGRPHSPERRAAIAEGRRKQLRETGGQ